MKDASKAFAKVAHTKRGVTSLDYALKSIIKTKIYVGIPEGGKGDKRDDQSPITNSALGFIHEFGAPSRNIPARPFLEPSIRQAREEISGMMKKAAVRMIHGDVDAYDRILEGCALHCASVVKTYMTDADFQPLAKATIKARLYKHPGDDPDSMKPLLDTGSLRNAIEALVIKD